MTNLRKNPAKKIGKYEVLKLRDYSEEKITDIKTGKSEPTNLPKSNVLYYELENDVWCCVRPSGTEPKIKLYIGVKASNMELANTELNEMKEEMKKLIN